MLLSSDAAIFTIPGIRLISTSEGSYFLTSSVDEVEAV